MITTDRAAQKLKENLVQEFFDMGIGFRLISNEKNANNKDINMKLDRVKPKDTVVQSYGIKILLDPTSAASLDSYKLDYKKDSGGFILKHFT